MAPQDGRQQQTSKGRDPWWVAAVGGGGGIVAAIQQDHALGWAIAAAFTAWLIHNIVITWMSKQ